MKCTDQTRTFRSQTSPHEKNNIFVCNYEYVRNYSYLAQFPIQTANTMLPVNIPLKYRNCFTEVLISTLCLNYYVCVLFIFSSKLLYNFMSTLKTPFWYKNVLQSETRRSWLSLVSYLCTYMITIFNIHVIIFYKNMILLKHKLKPLLKPYGP
jgi:hypothetical protein